MGLMLGPDQSELVIKPEQKGPRDDFELAFPAFAGSEIKCVALLCIDDSPSGGQSISQKIAGVAPDSDWKPSRSTVNHYLHTFERHGLVKRNVEGYVITDLGKRAKPVAGKLLEESSYLTHPLLETFSEVGTSGDVNGAINRVRLLSLLAQDPYRTQRVSDLPMPEPVASEQARNLSEIGLVRLDSRQHSFSLDNPDNIGNIKNFERYGDLFKEVFRLLVEMIAVNPDFKVEAETFTQILGVGVVGQDRLSLKAGISRALSSLVESAVLKRNFDPHKKYTDVQITPPGLHLVTNVIVPGRNTLNGDVNSMHEQWSQIPWQFYAAAGINRHTRVSRSIDSQELRETRQRIESILRDNPQGMTRRQVESEYKTRYGSSRRAQEHLISLKHRGLIKVDSRDLKGYVYSIIDPEANDSSETEILPQELTPESGASN